MATALGSLRNLLMTPTLAEVSFHGRGFPTTPSDVTRKLETIPQTVVCGFEWGIDARNLWEIERRVNLVEPELHGFAYEGVTMAYTIRDAMSGRRNKLTEKLLRGPAQPHIFLTYIGIGFAMAKLPRPLWKNILPDLTGVPYHPTMSWLAIDGLGFDRAYFDTTTWITEQKQPTPYPWDGWPDYFPRAFDQGIGRALWFIHGANVTDVTTAVNNFPTSRQADLWSGVGLAATFAGGCTAHDLGTLRHNAGAHAPHLAQGAIFAAKARTFSGYQPPQTETAITALTDLTVSTASTLADDVAVGGLHSDVVPEYEVWRTKIRESVGTLERH
ncbi:DUF1702 family protein [Micromonospora sp. NBC_01699]|uniref:DUF1702 family protein n=1 Tax=Micromonospora sp. NBC_01699 TaxID=2975984 RepID=UPI002E35B4A3|nr:DUF1702 family protein [Micromonospora sp. NBC_01699]